MNREEAKTLLKAQQENDDYEVAHGIADSILCRLLKELGYDDVVEEYEKVGKYYA